MSNSLYIDNLDIYYLSYSYVISLFGGLIIWKAARQNIVTTSLTKSEILGVAYTAKETIAL
jgi:hypothetical protein